MRNVSFNQLRTFCGLKITISRVYQGRRWGLFSKLFCQKVNLHDEQTRIFRLWPVRSKKERLALNVVYFSGYFGNIWWVFWVPPFWIHLYNIKNIMVLYHKQQSLFRRNWSVPSSRNLSTHNDDNWDDQSQCKTENKENADWHLWSLAPKILDLGWRVHHLHLPTIRVTNHSFYSYKCLLVLEFHSHPVNIQLLAKVFGCDFKYFTILCFLSGGNHV